MSDVQRRQKALAVVRDMDTEAIIEMLQSAPSQAIPTPSMDELMRELAEQDAEEELWSMDEFFSGGLPDPEIKPKDVSRPEPGLRSSQVISARGIAQGDGGVRPDKSRIMFASAGEMKAPKVELDLETPDVQYLGQLYGSDGSDRENYSDDEGWL